MTRSEEICNEIGAKFFCKDFVYENLVYFNQSNKKVELCDALFEYGSIYLALQIKERSLKKGNKSDEEWLKEVVYGEAVKQMQCTIEAIKNDCIHVNDLYHQKVDVHNRNKVFPLIVFDNPAIAEYKRSIDYNGITINIFSLIDYKSMMEVLVLPYDIFYYLHERNKLSSSKNGLPHIAMGENKNASIIAQIANEEDLVRFFKLYVCDGDLKSRDAAIKLISIIRNFRENQFKKNPDYKFILRILQHINERGAASFLERFEYAWDSACKNQFDFSKAVMLSVDGEKISIVFFSVGNNDFSNKRYYEVLFDAKQLQHHTDSVLLICFIGSDSNECQIKWIYSKNNNPYDEETLNFYKNLGMFSGWIDREKYEIICKRIIEET